MTSSRKPRIALWFRYGPAEHTELFHAMPEIVEALARSCEVHYFGMRSDKAMDPRIARHARLHLLPFTVRRTDEKDKFRKTALWLLCLPWIGLRCRGLGVRAVYIDETIPLTALLARIFFGPRVAITVADFFVDVYATRSTLVRMVRPVVRALDLASWKKLPLIFTRARSTRAYLAEQGVPPQAVQPVYDPCDLSIYRPLDRRAAKARFGWGPDEVVLVHHGILHPNKGNDLILQALAPLRASLPNLRYLLVGDGPEMGRLKQLTAQLGLQDVVVFTGWLATLDEVNQALNAGDIGLVMRIGQKADDFHMTGALVHSLACGLPVLAAKLAGVSEVVREGENGLLFPPDDMAVFQEKLAVLARDPELRLRLGRAALETAKQNFDMQKVTNETVQPLLRLAGVAP